MKTAEFRRQLTRLAESAKTFAERHDCEEAERDAVAAELALKWLDEFEGEGGITPWVIDE